MILHPDRIKGVNIGGWLMMEGYILQGRNIAENEFKANFKKLYGKDELKKFETAFRKNFIQEQDFKNIAVLGANAIRLPFNQSLLEKKPFIYDEDGFRIFEDVFAWADKYNLSVILDLHAACGAQNIDWHSDSRGEAKFWHKKEYQERACRLWQEVVARFKDRKSLLGFDLLNEPMPAQGRKNATALKNFYKNTIKAIRSIDREHFIFLEGDDYAQKIDFLKDLIGEKIRLSIHAYLPLNYTFNFTRFLKFPGNIEGRVWDRGRIKKYLEPYYKFARENKTRIFVGEFGVNWRGGAWGELVWLEAILGTFEEFGFDYTYWTYKAVSNNVFPDGLYQYLGNNKFIKREGPVYGWENYIPSWLKDNEKIIDFWKTKNFPANAALIKVLSRFFSSSNR